MSKEDRTTAIGLFNYAHSYASAARALDELNINSTHPNAPVNFLYFHAVELYLKSFLVALGFDLDELRKNYGHKVLPLFLLAREHRLDLDSKSEEAIALMSKTDNVITARYIRTGIHKRLPIVVYDDLCRSLNIQVAPTAYKDSGITRIPTL